MKMTRLLSAALAPVLVGGVVLVVAVSGGSAKKAQPSVAAASAVSVKQTSLGKTLVDANGRTLYLFQADKPGVSNLSQAGLAVWPAFTATETPLAASDFVAIPDSWADEAMRALADGDGDTPVISGESAAGGMGVLIAAASDD